VLTRGRTSFAAWARLADSERDATFIRAGTLHVVDRLKP
jgi:hypothetical protein